MTRARLFSTGNVGVGGGSAGGTANITLAGLQPFLTTANVVELTSLYFSNTRVYANLQLASIDALYDVNVAVKATGQALIWNGNIWAPGNVFSSLSLFTTADLPEAQSNLYYTNARARTALTAADPTVIIDWVAGTIRANVIAIANSATTTDGVTEGFVNKYYTNARSFANLQLASINDLFDVVITNIANNQVLAYNGVTGKWENNTILSASASFAENSNFANVSLTSNIANVVLSISNFTTANLIESSANLYFTNARVLSALSNATIQGNLRVGETLFANSLVINGNEVLTGAQGTILNAQIITANTITANTITAKVWNGLYTANIIESSSNLFFTNARVNAVVQPFLTTANVRELSSNLYFTNARANAAIWPSLTTANVIESAGNVYFTNARVLITLATNSPNVRDISVNGNLLVYGNVAQLNVGNVQISSRTITIAKDATTRTAAEGAGIYINGANARITYGEVGDTIGFNKDITVLGNILPAISGVYNIGSADKKFLSLFLGTQTIFLGNVALGESPKGGLSATTPTGAASDGLFGNLVASEFVTLDRVYGNVLPITEFKGLFGGNVLQFTSNVTGNLYFGIKKNDDWNKFAGIRVVQTRVTASNVRSDVIIYNDNDVTNNSTARISILGDGNVNILGNIYLDGSSKFDGNVKGDLIGNVIGTVSTLFNHSTDSLKEGTNLYYTNSRVRSTLSNSTGVYYNSSTGQFSIGQDVATTSSVAFRNLTVTGNIFVLGNAAYINSNTLVVNDPLIQLGYGNPSDVFDLGLVGHYNNGVERHAGIFRDHTDGNFKIFDNLTSEPGTNDIDTSNVSFRYANLVVSSVQGNLIGDITGTAGFARSISNFTTGNLSEGSNQYFTNARVLANVEQMSVNVFTDVDISGIQNNGILIWNGSKFVSGTISDGATSNTALFAYVANVANTVLTLNNFNTANLVEGVNQYFTNARVVSALIAGQNITIEANGRISSSTSANINVQDIVANTVLTLSNFTTANLAEGTNLYFTNARVLANVEQMSINVFADVDLTGLEYNANYNYTLFWSGTKFTAHDSRLIVPFQSTRAYLANVADIAYFANTAGIANIALVTNFANVSGITNFANTAGIANVANTVLTLNNFNTANLVEGVNLYYTNSRTISAVTPLLTAANVVNFDLRTITTTTPLLTTANVVEGANLYFTNARVVSALIAGQNITIEANGRISASANIVVQDIVANTVLTLSNFTTTNLIEGSNLYYKDSRVYSNVANILPQYTGQLQAGNITTLNKISYANTTQVVKVYQYYNEATQSLDTIFL